VWDFFLGGSHNFAVDRQVAQAAIAIKPDMPELARRVRLFLRRAVRAIAEAGVDQFLDIGAEIPTVGPVHEIARAVYTQARVAYMDHDPAAVTHGQAILEGDPGTVFVRADLRQPKQVPNDPRVRDLLDFAKSIGLLLCGALHVVPHQDNPAGIVATLRDALPPGSHLALQHATIDVQPPETIAMLGMWNTTSPEPMYWRTRQGITGLLSGFTVLAPGVVLLPAAAALRLLCPAGPHPHPRRRGSRDRRAARTTQRADPDPSSLVTSRL
jgi:hypothetical protein